MKERWGPKVLLILIPFRDKWDLTHKCLESLLRQKTNNLKLKIILIDNGSCEESTRQGVEKFVSSKEEGVEFRSIRINEPFNFSKLNNTAFKSVDINSFDYVMMLNNDIEFRYCDSLEKMTSVIASNDSIGSVGCTLVYPDESIQHLFVFPGSKIVGSHPFRGGRLNIEEEWYRSVRKVPAITGAVMLLRKEVFESVRMFDENLPNCYQDVDLCLKIQKAGWDNVVVPYVIMTHYETQTRKPMHHWSEVEYMYDKWGSFLMWNPQISNKLSRWSEKLIIDSPSKKEFPWQKLVEKH